MSIKKTLRIRIACSVVAGVVVVIAGVIAKVMHANIVATTAVVAVLSMYVVDPIVASFGKDVEDLVDEIKPLINSAEIQIKTLINGVNNNVTELRTHVSGIQSHLETKWDHRRFGNRDEALKYVAHQLNHASVQSVLNTDVRAQGHDASYDSSTLELLQAEMTEWLRRPGVNWTEVRGPRYDKDCVAHIVAAAQAFKQTARIAPTFVGRQLGTDVPILNFTILDYGGRREVLFGWGRHKRSSEDDVFACGDALIVRAFADFFALLESSSSEVGNPAELIEDVAETSTKLCDWRNLTGSHQFWYPHFRNGARNTIVYTEPLFFRVFIDEETRLFIRDIDLNDTDPKTGDEDQKNALKRKLLWLNGLLKKGSDFQVSRGYIPGGEVFAKDHIRIWMDRYANYFLQHKFIDAIPKCEEEVSHEAKWISRPYRHDGGERSLMDDNLIILGNLRSNPNVRQLRGSYRYQHFECALNPSEITVKALAPAEEALLNKCGCRYERVDGLFTKIIEDWKKESIVLVTRGASFAPLGVATFILANQGRGVHAVAQQFLTNEERWSSLAKNLALPQPLPSEFQMLFHVDLKNEARYGECNAILYRGYA